MEALEAAGLDGEDVPVEDFVEHDTSRISVWKLVALPAHESGGTGGTQPISGDPEAEMNEGPEPQEKD